MEKTPNCIKCQSSVTYFDGSLFHCTECFHAWTQEDMEAANESGKVLDSNGNELFDGDDVTVIKDLKVKGSSMVIKRGTRVRGIRLSEEDPTHVQGRVDGQTIFILTEFLKK
ncbi:MAG TPA: alkylphosphonate utilization protein [Bacteroidales bacterium]|jgi:protein PhnA|nr:alkylphosphonate utilization protein [Bacteroidales bacterium]